MLKTQRLICEELRAVHATELFEGLHDDRLYEFIDDDPPADLESLRSRYERLEVGKSPDGREIWLNWAIRLREKVQLVGTVQATVFGDQSALIAYVLVRDAWGQGYGREAVAEMIRHLRGVYSVSNKASLCEGQGIHSRFNFNDES